MFGRYFMEHLSQKRKAAVSAGASVPPRGSRWCATLTVVVAAAACAGPLRAATFESGDAQTALVELFTSEGCSSCPPAEARLAKLRDAPGLWKEFVPVAFHVDYWDGLGWPDRFASPVFTARQRAYAARWRSTSVYTPAFVRNGREGNDPTSSTSPGRLRVQVDPGGEIRVTFRSANFLSSTGFIVEAVPQASGVTSDVRRGENAGRKLVHEFVALDLLRATMERHGDTWSATLALPAKTVVPTVALAVWVHTADDPAALQATGGWLKP